MIAGVRLFQPEEAPGPRKLRECYDEWLRPQHQRKASRSTLQEYETTLRHWERLTGDPAVSSVVQKTIDDFVDALLADEPKPKQPETVNKHLRNLRTILRRCVPQGVSPRGQTHGRHVLDWLPTLDMLPETKPEPRVIDLDELTAIYKACSVATRVTGAVPAPLVWRTLLLTKYTFGPRTRDLCLMPLSALYLDPPCPLARLRKVEHEHGWIGYVATKTRRYKPYPLYLPIPKLLRLHIDELLKVLGGTRLFPVGNRMNDWHAQWNEIQRAAKIDEPLYLLKELRQTCATTWNEIEGSGGLLGEHVCGHAKLGVNARHYDQATRRVVRYVSEFPYSDQMMLF